MTDWTAPNTEYPPPKANEPALHAAARLGDHDAIRRLVAEGADVNETFDIGLDPDAWDNPATPLMVAASSGDGATVETVHLLLELGADPTITIRGNSAANFACSGLGWNYRPGGELARLELLLNAGAPLGLTGEEGNRTFCDAAERGNADVVRLLLAHGANPNGHWDQEVARQRHLEMNEQMRAYRAEDEANAQFRELIGDDDFDELTASMDAQFFQSMTSAPSGYEIPLFRAAESGSAECARAIIDAGADPLKRDNQQRTALFYAASEEVARELMRAGLSLDDRDTYSWTPLDDAVSSGPDAIPRIEALIAAGADVNATHDRGYTVFMSAAGSMSRERRILEILVEAGADPHAVTELGYNAFHAAVDVNGEANEEVIVRAILGYLKELGVDIDVRNKHGHTPIARAIEEGTGLEVRVLAELGADVNVVCPRHVCGEDGCGAVTAPIVFAAIASAVDSDAKLAALLKAGVNLDVVDEEGRSPLEHARADLEGHVTDESGLSYVDEWTEEARRCVQMLEAACAREA